MAVPSSHGEGNRKNQHGADLLKGVADAKHAAATKDPGADRNAANAAKAAREWRGGADKK